MTDLSNERFQSLLARFHREGNGIGTLGEHDLHALIKDFLSPREHQEIPIGPFVADIARGSEIVEVQTASYAPLRKKLKAFLANYEVTIVTPLFVTRQISWIDARGNLSRLRTSPVHENVLSSFSRLYEIRPFLSAPNLHFLFLMFEGVTVKEVENYRGQARHGRKILNEPVSLISSVFISSLADFKKYLPRLPKAFTSKDLAREAHIPLKTAQEMLLILSEAGIIMRLAGKAPYHYEL